MRKLENINIGLARKTSVSRISRMGSTRLTVVIAGFGYSLDMPIFYYLWKLQEDHPTDILQVDFGYSKDSNFLGLSESEQDKQFDADIALVREYLESSMYLEFILIGKSLGTTVCHQILRSPDISKRAIGAIWLTPGTTAQAIGSSIPLNGLKNLLVYGTKDRYIENVNIDDLSKQENVEVYSVVDGNHSLESGDVSESIELLKGIVVHIRTYLEQF